MENTQVEQFVELVGSLDGRQILGAHIIGPQASLLIELPSRR